MRNAAHEHDARLRDRGAAMAIAGAPVQVRNHDDAGVRTIQVPFLRADLPIAGFAVIEAVDMNEAIQLVSGTPCAVAHGVVEVWPLVTPEERASGWPRRPAGGPWSGKQSSAPSPSGVQQGPHWVQASEVQVAGPARITSALCAIDATLGAATATPIDPRERRGYEITVWSADDRPGGTDSPVDQRAHSGDGSARSEGREAAFKRG